MESHTLIGSLTNSMKISVIIPAHNEEKNIGDSLKAILAQDYPDYEVIVVDNNSTDGTAEIARPFNVKVVHESNKGTMWSCERGRKEAVGELVVRMDADCLPEKDWLSIGASYFSKETVVAASGPYDYYDAAYVFRYASLLFQIIIYGIVSIVIQKPFRYGGIMIGGNSFIRTKTLESIGGFNTAITFYGDDTEIAKRLAKKGYVIFTPNLTLKTSWRRFEREGIIKLQMRYLYHFFKQLFKK